MIPYLKVPETTIEKTERICFSGSILSGILIGKYADTEISEASIARLWNIQDQAWDENNFDKMSNITSKLGTTCDSSKSLGSVSSYCAKRWRMSKSMYVSIYNLYFTTIYQRSHFYRMYCISVSEQFIY